jgi:hypothetical protein
VAPPYGCCRVQQQPGDRIFHLDVSVGFTRKPGVRARTPERLETLLLDTKDVKLIAKLAKLMPVIRMAEEIRVMAADLKGPTSPRNAIVIRRIGHLEMAREDLFLALSLAWLAVWIVYSIYAIFLPDSEAVA